MKKIIVFAALLAMAFTAGAQDFEATFKQAKTLKISGKVIKSEGEITYTAPDQLAMLYTNPDGDYFIIDGPQVRMDMRGVAVDLNATGNKLVQSQRNAILYSVQGKYEEIAKEMGIPVERVREILKISQEPVSLETPIGEEEDSHLGDFIQDDNVPVPADAAAFTLLKEQLVEVLDTLTEREQKVLRLRFGLDDGRARTLEEVGKEFNVTRERIRQIEAKALRKLRHPSRSRKLKDYLD